MHMLLFFWIKVSSFANSLLSASTVSTLILPA
ncbi:MAG: hypothetical protein ACI936_003535 [Paraglaciecola sp.]